ncbi:MAG: type II secretion system protein [Candidatus Berkelbacteria bacterium]
MKNIRNIKGFSLVEILLAVALFSVFSVGVISLVLQGWNTARLAQENSVAKEYASEGIEAARSIKNQSFASLINTSSTGIVQSGGVWTFSGTNNTFDSNKFTRTIAVADVYRDVSNNIVATGGTLDPLSKKITSTVNWNISPTRADSSVISTYLTNWKSSFAVPKKGGILVYGAGGTTTDAIKYKIFDANAKTWSAELSASDVDTGSTNKALRAAKVYSSATRNEKVLISRHYNGTNQYIYGQVFNGTSWNTPQLLATLTVNTFLDVQNFDGTYLANGDFMAVFSDNTTTPKSRTWNGTVWSGEVATQNVGGIPNYIIVKQRDATNEVMVVTFDQLSDTNSEYFSGGAYATGSWTLHTEHSAVAPVNTEKIIDFSWNSTDPTKGILLFSNNANDRNIRYKMFTANGLGGGSWGNTTNGANQGTPSTRTGVLEALSSPTATTFIACDQNTVPQVICYRSDTALTITNPTNQIIAPTADSGIQKAFDMGYEMLGGTYAVSVYADATITPKLKKYNQSTNTFDAAATNLNNLVGTLKTVRVIPQPATNEMIIVLADTNMTLYTIFWDGTNHQVYSSADALGFTTHGSTGSAAIEYYYDFGWDIF